MAKKFRTEREILTIEVPVEIPVEQLPEGVSSEKSTVLKISAYPAVWRWLKDNVDDRQLIDTLIDGVIWDAYNKIPRERIKKKDIDNNDFDKSFDYSAIREERIDKGIHFRGLHNKPKQAITNEIKSKARWILSFFRLWQKRKPRPDNIQLIYDGTRKEGERATSDPTDMTYFCCRFFYEEKFHKLSMDFPARESFRTTYLKNGPIRLRQNTTEEVMKLVEKQDHQLNIIAEVCRKLQK